MSTSTLRFPKATRKPVIRLCDLVDSDDEDMAAPIVAPTPAEVVIEEPIVIHTASKSINSPQVTVVVSCTHRIRNAKTKVLSHTELMAKINDLTTEYMRVTGYNLDQTLRRIKANLSTQTKLIRMPKCTSKFPTLEQKFQVMKKLEEGTLLDCSIQRRVGPDAKPLYSTIITDKGLFLCDTLTVKSYKNLPMRLPNKPLLKQPEDAEFDIVNINDYTPDDSYHSYRPNATYDGNIGQKWIVDNNIRFQVTKKFNVMLFDIETFHTSPEMWNKLPLAEDNTAHIGCICFVWIPGEDRTKRKIFIYHLKTHKVDRKVVLDKINTEFDDPAKGVKAPQLAEKNLHISEFTNDEEMSYEFLVALAKINKPFLLVGFNSSSDVRNKAKESEIPPGYDIGFIYKKASMITKLSKPMRGQRKTARGDVYITKHLRELQQCYLYDLSLYLPLDIRADDMNMMPNHSLDSYLTYYGLPNKAEHNYYQLQKTFASSEADVSDIVFYCAMDCDRLWLLDQKAGTIGMQTAIVNDCNVPLGMALYSNRATCVFSSLLSNMFESDYMCGYSHMIKDKNRDDNPEHYMEKSTYQGALTMINMDPDVQGKVHRNIYDCDFGGYFPSIIKQYNISPETLVDEEIALTMNQDDLIILDIDDEKHESHRNLPNYTKRYYFLKHHVKLGLYPAYITKITDERAKLKKLKASATGDDKVKYSNAEKIKKLQANTIYGLLGAANSLCTPACAIVVTSMSRRIIRFMMAEAEAITGNKVTECDTDGAKIAITYEQVLELNKRVQAKFGSFITIGDIDNYQEYLTKVHTYYLPSSHPKTYSAINLGESTDVMGADERMFALKGMSWSAYTPQGKTLVINLFRHIFASEELDTNLRKFINDTRRTLRDCIQYTNWRETLAIYCKHIKFSGKSPIVAALEKRYPDVTDEKIAVCLIKDKCSLKAPRYRILNDPNLDPKTIDLNEIFNSFYSSVAKLTKPISRRKKIANVHSNDTIIYRVDKLDSRGLGYMEKGAERLKCDSLEDFVRFWEDRCIGPDSSVSVHEISGDKTRLYRFYCDIDGLPQSEEYMVSYLADKIVKVINMPNLRVFHTKVYKPTTISVHMYINIAMTTSSMLAIRKRVLPMICGNEEVLKTWYKIWDDNVYSTSLRVPGCPKFYNGLPPARSNVHVITSGTIHDHLICNIEGLETWHSIETCNVMLYPLPKVKETICQGMVDDINKFLTEIIPKTKAKFKLNNQFCHINFAASWHCPNCNRRHDNENAFISCKTNDEGYEIIFKCYRNKEASSKKQIISSSDAPTKKIGKVDYYNRFELIENYMAKIDVNAEESSNIDPDVISTEGDIQLDIADILEGGTHLLSIKSAPGNGKSLMISRYLNSLDASKSILVLSFRRSFTKSFQTKYNLESYMDIKSHEINFARHSRLIVQMDSVMRLQFDNEFVWPDVLILDEVCSLLEQVQSSQIKHQEPVLDRFTQLLRRSKAIICMDALLTEELSEGLAVCANIAHDQTRFINHTFSRYTEKPLIVYIMPTNNEVNAQKLADHTSGVLNRMALFTAMSEYPVGTKLGAFVSSQLIAQDVAYDLIKIGHKVLLLDGKDASSWVDAEGNEERNYKLKEKYFTDPELILKDYDVFIYTPTLTAGVSIERTPVKHFFCMYNGGTCSPIATIQAMFRIRQRDNNTMFLCDMNDSRSAGIGITPAKVLQLDRTLKIRCESDVIPDSVAITALSRALVAQCNVNRWNMTLSMLKRDIKYDVYIHSFDTLPIHKNITQKSICLGDLTVKNMVDVVLPTAAEIEVYNKFHGKDASRLSPEEKDTLFEVRPETVDFIKTAMLYGYREVSKDGKQTASFAKVQDFMKWVINNIPQNTLVAPYCKRIYTHRWEVARKMKILKHYGEEMMFHYNYTHESELRQLLKITGTVAADRNIASDKLQLDDVIRTHHQCKTMSALIKYMTIDKPIPLTDFEGMLPKDPHLKQFSSGRYKINDLNKSMAGFTLVKSGGSKTGYLITLTQLKTPDQ